MKFSLKRITRIALLSAICVVSRMVFAAFPNVKPIFALFLIFLEVFGLLDALIIMIITLLITGIFLGFGVWIVGQVASFGVLFCVWKGLFSRLKLLYIKSLAAGVLALVYGFLISMFMFRLFGGTSFWAFYLTGIPFDSMHALATLISYPILTSGFAQISRFFSVEK